MAKPSPKSAGDYLDEILPMRPGTAPMNDIFELIERDKIEPWPAQPRTHITPDQVEAKRDSISKGFQEAKGLSKTGIETALIVRHHPDPQKRREGYVMLIEGELRWRGTEPIRLDVPLPKMLPCNVRDVTEEEAWEIAAVTGVQRQEYTPVQEANIIALMMQGKNKEKRKLSVRDIADRLGKKKSWVSDRLLIADPDDNAPQQAKDLIAELQAMVSERSDTLIHARELKKVADKAQRRKLIKQVIGGMSLDALRKAIEPKEEKNQGASANPPASGQSSGSGSSSGGSSDFQGNSTGGSAGTTSRSHTSGLPADRDIVRDNLRPAVSFLAEAARNLGTTKISAKKRKELLDECDRAEEQLQEIRAKAGG